jgi:hypothetical protein
MPSLVEVKVNQTVEEFWKWEYIPNSCKKSHSYSGVQGKNNEYHIVDKIHS